MNFGYVPPPFAAGLWGKVAPLLSAAVTRGGNDWQDVAEQLADQRAQLWLTEVDGEPVAAMVTRLDGDTIEVWLAGGAVLSGSVPFLDVAIDAAREAGATNGRIIGRKGWARVLRSYGWHPAGDSLVKDWA